LPDPGVPRLVVAVVVADDVVVRIDPENVVPSVEEYVVLDEIVSSRIRVGFLVSNFKANPRRRCRWRGSRNRPILGELAIVNPVVRGVPDYP
jgi:hypothetical protein